MNTNKVIKIIWRESLIVIIIILITQWSSIFHVFYLTANFSKIFSIDNFQGNSKDPKLFYYEGKLWYLKKKSVTKNEAENLFLHVYPRDKKDLSIHRQPSGFENLDSIFQKGFDSLPKFTGKGEYYFIGIELPKYKIRNISTGLYDSSGRIWEYNFVPAVVLSESDREKIFSQINFKGEANDFEIYIYDHKIYYLNRNSIPASKNDLFFLHVYPYDISELEKENRQVGYDNLDFDYTSYRIRLPESSGITHYLIACQEIPRYRFQRIETGQYNTKGRTWQFIVSDNQ